jgi:hypothetical protein
MMARLASALALLVGALAFAGCATSGGLLASAKGVFSR